jgi:hypothetical protein
LGFTAGRAAEIKIARGHNEFGALVYKFHGRVADGDRITFAVNIHEFDLFAQNASMVVEVFDGNLGTFKTGFIQRGLDTGETQSAANQDFIRCQ